MSIATFLKTIGRGKEGARALTQAQAGDLMGRILDGQVSDLELGAFCIAMRVKGETTDELLGFLDAINARTRAIGSLPAPGNPNVPAPYPAHQTPTIVLPSYNGARKLPLLTPLLALMLVREGCAVMVHGTRTETQRVTSEDVLNALGHPPNHDLTPLAPGQLKYLDTATLLPGLQRLLQVRTVIGLRNSGHSLVKLMRPLKGPSLLVSSYTHPAYLTAMTDVLCKSQATALLLRGTEGEAVADPRRQPRIDAIFDGQVVSIQAQQAGSLGQLPDLPTDLSVASIAAYTENVLSGRLPTPAPLVNQVQSILKWLPHAR